LAIREQSEKPQSRKPVPPSQTFDLLGPGQHGQGCRDLWIAYFEQSAGARRFQNQFVVAPSHIGEPRQDKRVRGGERRRFGPIIGSLRFYDDEILAAARGAEAELQETALRQAPRQQIDLLVDIPSVGREGGERQTFSQFPRAIGRGRAERSETDGVAMETGRDSPYAFASSATRASSRTEKAANETPRALFVWGARNSASTSAMRVNRIEFVFLERLVAPAELHRHVVKTAGREAAIEMA